MGIRTCPSQRKVQHAMAAAMKAMKAMKVMKKKKVSVIAKGPRSKASVFAGYKVKTQSGLTQAALTQNRRGKIVSKKAQAAGKKAYKNVSGWTKAVREARKTLALTGFVAVNGKTAQGKALYPKAKAIYNQ